MLPVGQRLYHFARVYYQVVGVASLWTLLEEVWPVGRTWEHRHELLSRDMALRADAIQDVLKNCLILTSVWADVAIGVQIPELVEVLCWLVVFGFLKNLHWD